jgi:hypothetical protein
VTPKGAVFPSLSQLLIAFLRMPDLTPSFSLHRVDRRRLRRCRTWEPRQRRRRPRRPQRPTPPELRLLPDLPRRPATPPPARWTPAGAPGALPVSPRVPDIRPLGFLPVYVYRRGRCTSAVGLSFNPTAWSPSYPFEPVSHRQAGPACRDSFFFSLSPPGARCWAGLLCPARPS